MSNSTHRNLLQITVDAGMLASIRHTVVSACGDQLEFLRVKPIARSSKVQMQVCLATGTNTDRALDSIMRRVSSGLIAAARHTGLTLLDILLPGKSSRQRAYARAGEAGREQSVTEYDNGRNNSNKGSRMNHVTQVLSAEDILLDLDASTKKLVFEAAGRHFERRHGISQAQVVKSLIAREQLGSTGLGQGVALPHARIRHLPQAMAAFVQLKLPISFDAPDAKPVSDMLILLVPEHATEQHLQILAEFAQMLGDRNFREQIRACDEAGAMYRLFSAWPQS